jgi:hypothetical protein
VHGLGVALGSEIVALSEVERRQVTRVVVEQARGRVPVVILRLRQQSFDPAKVEQPVFKGASSPNRPIGDIRCG